MFGNDAHDVWIHTQYNDDDRSKYLCVMAAEDFRKLALWYLWRWVWGEWCGLRRWLFYKRLRQQVRRMEAQRNG
jgi:hypothetical protein